MTDFSLLYDITSRNDALTKHLNGTSIKSKKLNEIINSIDSSKVCPSSNDLKRDPDFFKRIINCDIKQSLIHYINQRRSHNSIKSIPIKFPESESLAFITLAYLTEKGVLDNDDAPKFLDNILSYGTTTLSTWQNAPLLNQNQKDYWRKRYLVYKIAFLLEFNVDQSELLLKQLTYMGFHKRNFRDIIFIYHLTFRHNPAFSSFTPIELYRRALWQIYQTDFSINTSDQYSLDDSFDYLTSDDQYENMWTQRVESRFSQILEDKMCSVPTDLDKFLKNSDIIQMFGSYRNTPLFFFIQYMSEILLSNSTQWHLNEKYNYKNFLTNNNDIGKMISALNQVLDQVQLNWPPYHFDPQNTFSSSSHDLNKDTVFSQYGLSVRVKKIFNTFNVTINGVALKEFPNSLITELDLLNQKEIPTTLAMLTKSIDERLLILIQYCSSSETIDVINHARRFTTKYYHGCATPSYSQNLKGELSALIDLLSLVYNRERIIDLIMNALYGQSDAFSLQHGTSFQNIRRTDLIFAFLLSNDFVMDELESPQDSEHIRRYKSTSFHRDDYSEYVATLNMLLEQSRMGIINFDDPVDRSLLFAINTNNQSHEFSSNPAIRFSKFLQK